MECVLSYPELLSHIFSFLNFSSIKTVRSVSKFWKQQSEYYKFWKNVELELDEFRVKRVSKKLLKIISRIRIICVDERYTPRRTYYCRTYPHSLSPSFFKKISSSSLRLKELNLQHVNLSERDFAPKLLSIIPRLNILKLEWCKIDTFKLSSLELNSIYQQITNLKLLLLNDVMHTCVPPDLLALSLTKVEKVILESAYLSTEQLTLIYQEISSSSNCNLKYLKIDRSDHTNVDTQLMIRAFSKLKQINIETCRIEFEQLMDILFAIDRGEIKSEYVCLYAYFEYILHLPSDLILRLQKGPLALELKWIGLWGLVHYKRFYKVFHDQFYKSKLNRSPFHYDFMEGSYFS